MGWSQSFGILRFGAKKIADYYINVEDNSILFTPPTGSRYGDWLISSDGVIQFKVTSDDTGDMASSLTGEINGFPYFTNGTWNIWYDAEMNLWILATPSSRTGFKLGMSPKESYSYNGSTYGYDYNGDEYYTCSNFNYVCLSGTAGTFTKNTDGSTITMSAVWPSNFLKQTNGTGKIGYYEGGKLVGFHYWGVTISNPDGTKTYNIYKLDTRKYGHIMTFDSADLEDVTPYQQLAGICHTQFTPPNLDTNMGFYIHQGLTKPEVDTDYVMKWCHWVPATPLEQETYGYDGYFVFETEYEGVQHPDITFSYMGLIDVTDDDELNRRHIFMTDTSCWR